MNAQAAAFGRYIAGRTIDETTIERYGAAARMLHYNADDAVVRFAVDHPWSLGPLDGALALVRPHALLRRKLVLMAAILEAQPAYCDAFLPRDRSAADALGVAWAVVRAGLCAALGMLLLLVVR